MRQKSSFDGEKQPQYDSFQTSKSNLVSKSYDNPPVNPSEWPQFPLMVRPTPGSSTRVVGIRRSKSTEYENIDGFHSAHILPINNGKEPKGESVLVDFESIHFTGTLLLRIKQAPSFEKENITKCENIEGAIDSSKYASTENDYFANRKRKFQFLIKGRFKTQLSMSRCVTGQIFERPAAKLPSKWIVGNVLKFFSALAPQLDFSIDGDRPRFLTPLVATAQTVSSDDAYDCQIHSNNERVNQECDSELHHKVFPFFMNEASFEIEEPSSFDSRSILSSLSRATNSIPDTGSYSTRNRVVARKKIFNALSSKNNEEPRFDTGKVYTFEFYQHLIDFGDQLSIDMGMFGGMIPIAGAMDGQPLKVMGGYKTNDCVEALWSFDIFHNSLVP